jgi:hypothetical protein
MSTDSGVREVTCAFYKKINRPYYSYGDSSGIEPDSLLIPPITISDSETNYGCKCKINKVEIQK